MKTPAMSRWLLTVPTLAAVLLSLPAIGLAADKAAAPKNVPQSTSPEAEGYDLWIADGVFLHRSKKLEPTLGNVVDALRERFTDANIALAPGLSALKISDLKLRAGQLSDELEAIRVASGSKFEWIAPGSAGPNTPPGSSGLDPATGLPSPLDTATGRPFPSPESLNKGLFVLREAPPTPGNERTVEAFNLSGYIQWLWTKDKEPADGRAKAAEQSLHDVEKIVLETIETLKQGNLGSQDQPRFQFHRGANLLVAIGTIETVEIVRKVVNALPGQVEAASAAAGGYGEAGSSHKEAVNQFMERYGVSRSPAPGAPGLPRR